MEQTSDELTDLEWCEYYLQEIREDPGLITIAAKVLEELATIADMRGVLGDRPLLSSQIQNPFPPPEMIEALSKINTFSSDIFRECCFTSSFLPKINQWVFVQTEKETFLLGQIDRIEKTGIVRVHLVDGSIYRFSNKSYNDKFRTTKSRDGWHSLLYSIELALSLFDH